MNSKKKISLIRIDEVAGMKNVYDKDNWRDLIEAVKQLYDM